MLDELQVDDLKDKVGQFHDKIETQINQLASMREKVTSIKENYDKKFEELFMQFKNIESLFLQGYFEKETLGDIKNSKHKQKEIVTEIQDVLQ
jgi:hypothetical protein